MKRSFSAFLLLLAASGAIALAAFACGDLDEYYTHTNSDAGDGGAPYPMRVSGHGSHMSAGVLAARLSAAEA